MQYSNVYLLKKRSKKTIRIGLDRKTVGRLRSALRHHEKMTATIYGAVVDPSGNIERQSARSVAAHHGLISVRPTALAAHRPPTRAPGAPPGRRRLGAALEAGDNLSHTH